MASDNITFNCPSCGIRLSVPSALAGVEGPCPSCSASIRAPLTAALPTVEEPPFEPILAKPALPAMPQASEVPPPGPRIRPEPRELPERDPEARQPITPRKSTEDQALRRYPVQMERRERGSRSLYRLMVPIGFITVVVLVILSIFLTSRRNGTLINRPLVVLPPAYRDGSTPKPKADDALSRPMASDASIPETRAPLPPAAVPNLEVPPPLDLLPDSLSPNHLAGQVLEEFLQAKDAATRAPLCEPQISEQAMAGTILAGPMPEVEKIDPESSRENTVEGFTEFLFEVILKQDGKSVQYSMVVRKRGDQPPKVYIDPVLDLMGGRLTKFASTPGKEIGTFHVVLEAISGCYEHGMPDADHKHTFKLMRGQLGRDIARAYIVKDSRFQKMLEDPDSPLHWGARLKSTVSLRWNMTEDPAHPYLEVIDIKAFDWDS
jgi:hypothetical protein